MSHLIGLTLRNSCPPSAEFAGPIFDSGHPSEARTPLPQFCIKSNGSHIKTISMLSFSISPNDIPKVRPLDKIEFRAYTLD